MKGTVRLARIAGIEIDAHWSLLAIAGLILVSLATTVLPELDPGNTAIAYWAVGIVVLLLFYVSLVAHEMAHSLVAKHNDVGVKRITLWLLGGVSELTSASRTGGTELAIAIVGPATSLAIGVLTLASAGVASMVGAPSVLATGLVWLGMINLMLALFNMLPAFPLDGGRVLRAALWMWSGEEEDATRQAAQVSKVVAYGVILLGIVLFVAGGGIGGLWFAILGWFILQAGEGEAQQVLARRALQGVTVGQLMSPHPTAVHPELTVQDLIDHFVLGHHHSSYPVVDHDGHPLGLVTLDTIRQLPPEHRSTARVDQIMVPVDHVPLWAPDAPAVDRLAEITASGTVRALVLDSAGRLVGLVSLSDVARAIDHHRLATSSS